MKMALLLSYILSSECIKTNFQIVLFAIKSRIFGLQTLFMLYIDLKGKKARSLVNKTFYFQMYIMENHRNILQMFQQNKI